MEGYMYTYYVQDQTITIEHQERPYTPYNSMFTDGDVYNGCYYMFAEEDNEETLKSFCDSVAESLDATSRRLDAAYEESRWNVENFKHFREDMYANESDCIERIQ